MRIFLSHGHEDADSALWLAREVREGLAKEGYDVEVFCTSEPEHRFPDPVTTAPVGSNFRDTIGKQMLELRRYLAEAIEDSSAYLLLLTSHTVKTARPWVRFEIGEAQKLARQRHIRFFPCLLGVGYEALREIQSAPMASEFVELEAGAPRPEHLGVDIYQAVRIDRSDELRQLVDVLASELADP